MRAVGGPMGWTWKHSVKQAVTGASASTCKFLKMPRELQGPASFHKASASMATAFGYTPVVLHAAVHWNPGA